MLLMPTTRPSASTIGPPELPGARRRSASSQRRLALCVQRRAMDDAERQRTREAERRAEGRDDVADPQRPAWPIVAPAQTVEATAGATSARSVRSSRSATAPRMSGRREFRS